MAEIKITATNFETEVLHSDKPVLVDFWADWCGPCRMLAPVLEELAREHEGELQVGKVNVDEEMSLAQQFGVTSIPMLLLFKDGKPVAKSVGYRPKAELEALLEQCSSVQQLREAVDVPVADGSHLGLRHRKIGVIYAHGVHPRSLCPPTGVQ